jgi:hypothetical protein
LPVIGTERMAAAVRPQWLRRQYPGIPEVWGIMKEAGRSRGESGGFRPRCSGYTYKAYETTMPTILLLLGWRIFFYANEGNEPVHVHCRKGEKECKYWLDRENFDLEEA